MVRSAVRLAAVARHQCALLASDPGPFIALTLIPVALMAVIRPTMDFLARAEPTRVVDGTGQAAAGMAVMFSLFILKLVGGNLLEERVTWHTWERVRSTPARLGEVFVGKAVPLFGFLLVQQAVLFTVAALAFGLRPGRTWWPLLAVAAAWSGCVLALGTLASTLVRTPAQLSAVGDVSAVTTTILAGALVPITMLPAWVGEVGPATPGYWAMAAYQAALHTGQPLGRPLLALAGFTVAAFLAAAWFGRRPG